MNYELWNRNIWATEHCHLERASPSDLLRCFYARRTYSRTLILSEKVSISIFFVWRCRNTHFTWLRKHNHPLPQHHSVTARISLSTGSYILRKRQWYIMTGSSRNYMAAIIQREITITQKLNSGNNASRQRLSRHMTSCL